MAKSLAVFLLITPVIASGCSASFPGQPSAPAALAAIAVRYSAFGTRLATDGLNAQFEAYTVDTDGVYVRVTNDATWSSSNPAALSVLQSQFLPGDFFPRAAGTADVRATFKGLVGSLTVTVRNPPLPRLEISSSGSASAPTLSVSLRSSAATTQDVTNAVTWSSSDPSIAEVRNRTIIGVTPGNVELRASYSGLSDSVWVGIPPRSR